MNTTGGPWKARGEAPRISVAQVETVAAAAANGLAIVVGWVASVALGAAVLMLLARGW